MTGKSILIATVTILLVALAYYAWNHNGPQSPDAVVQNDALDTQTTTEPSAKSSVQSESQPSPSEDHESGELIEPQPEKLEMETVLGIQVRKDRNCTVKIETYAIDEHGNQTPVYRCVPNDPKPQSIYETYSTAELIELAYSDTEAAFTLSTRLRESDFPTALEYALRAAALSGEGKYINYMTVFIPRTNHSHENPDLEYLKQAYVINGVAQAYDSNVSRSLHWRNRVAPHEGNGVDFTQLDERIANLVEHIHTIRREVGVATKL